MRVRHNVLARGLDGVLANIGPAVTLSEAAAATGLSEDAVLRMVQGNEGMKHHLYRECVGGMRAERWFLSEAGMLALLRKRRLKVEPAPPNVRSRSRLGLMMFLLRKARAKRAAGRKTP